MNSQVFSKTKLPDSPGVYFFMKGKQILYIGKATSLVDRVRSYYSNDLIATRGPLLVDMVFKADKIIFEKTDSVLEAIILEANLIKKHQPKYNTKEKDNKSFNYVVITKEEFPRVLVERGRNLDLQRWNLGSEKRFLLGKSDSVFSQSIFGPFPNATQLKEALKIIRKIFPFRDRCKIGQDRPCFNYQIGLCPGVCAGLISKKEYSKIIKNIGLFFEGKKTQIIKNLEKDMNLFAREQKFEEANKIKKTIFALNHIQDVALVKEDFSGKRFDLACPPKEGIPKRSNLKEEKTLRIEAYDVAHISGSANVGVMVVLEDGEPSKNEYRKFKINNSKQNDIAALKEVLERRFTHEEWSFPQIIVVDGGKAQINITRKVLEKIGLDIPVVSVLKNEYHKPKAVMGDKTISSKYSSAILIANSEAHRFAIKYHRSLISKIL